MSKTVLLRRRSAQGISTQNDEYKKKQVELREKSAELRSASVSLARRIETLRSENECWKQRIDLVDKDLSAHELSENGKASLLRLQTQARNAYEITGEELDQAQKLHAKMRNQQEGITGAISRLDNIQYELGMDADLNARRKELGMGKSAEPTHNLEGFLREIKQMEYTADALIKLRNENANH